MVSPSETLTKPSRVLVTGMAGFTGRYVAAELASAGHEVIGLTQPGGDKTPSEMAVDLCDRHALQAVVSSLRVDAVVHLAAISFVAHGDVDAIYRVNIVGTRNLLEALDKADTKPRIVVLASSANIYGNATIEPITEDVPPSPANDYAVSKLAMEYMARLWLDRLPIVITRPFNYTGIGQDGQFLIPKIVDHYRAGAREIELGNIDVVRDFLDVRDVAKLYCGIVERATPGMTLNLCSGQGHSLKEVLDLLGDIAGYRIATTVNPAFVRANEVNRLVGSARRITNLIGGFEPRALHETLRWMYASR